MIEVTDKGMAAILDVQRNLLSDDTSSKMVTYSSTQPGTLPRNFEPVIE